MVESGLESWIAGEAELPTRRNEGPDPGIALPLRLLQNGPSLFGPFSVLLPLSLFPPTHLSLSPFPLYPPFPGSINHDRRRR